MCLYLVCLEQLSQVCDLVTCCHFTAHEMRASHIHPQRIWDDLRRPLAEVSTRLVELYGMEEATERYEGHTAALHYIVEWWSNEEVIE